MSPTTTSSQSIMQKSMEQIRTADSVLTVEPGLSSIGFDEIVERQLEVLPELSGLGAFMDFNQLGAMPPNFRSDMYQRSSQLALFPDYSYRASRLELGNLELIYLSQSDNNAVIAQRYSKDGNLVVRKWFSQVKSSDSLVENWQAAPTGGALTDRSVWHAKTLKPDDTLELKKSLLAPKTMRKRLDQLTVIPPEDQRQIDYDVYTRSLIGKTAIGKVESEPQTNPKDGRLNKVSRIIVKLLKR